MDDPPNQGNTYKVKHASDPQRQLDFRALGEVNLHPSKTGHSGVCRTRIALVKLKELELYPEWTCIAKAGQCWKCARICQGSKLDEMRTKGKMEQEIAVGALIYSNFEMDAK